MNLIEYIKQSYQRPNRRILEGLGANECLIKYLMKTSENTNIKVVEALEDSKDIEWTTIRIEASELEEQPGTYGILSQNSEDLEKYEVLYNMYVNNEHPIIIGKYKMAFQGIARNAENIKGVGSFMLLEPNALITLDGTISLSYYQEDYDEQPTLLVERAVSENDFIEISFTKGLPYYTLSFMDSGFTFEAFIEKGETWQVPKDGDGDNLITYSDGINVYHANDIIVPTSNMDFEVIYPEGS